MYISKMLRKSWEKFLPFRDNCVLIGYVKLSVLRGKYFWSAVNLLKKRAEIFEISKILSTLKKCREKVEKEFSFLHIIASQPGVSKCLY